MQCAPCASNGPNHLGLCALSGANQSIGEGRPSGFPFPNEGHGPYTAFMGESTCLPRTAACSTATSRARLSGVRVQRLALHTHTSCSSPCLLHTHTSCSSPVRPTWRHPANTLSAERVPPSALSARCSNEHGRHRHARPPCRGGMRRRSQPPDPGAGSRRARGGRLV